MFWFLVIAAISVMTLGATADVSAAGQRALLIQIITASPKPEFQDAVAKARAIDLLGEERATEAIPALIDCLSDTRGLNGSDNWVGGHAANALRSVTGKDFGLDQQKWRDWYNTSKSLTKNLDSKDGNN